MVRIFCMDYRKFNIILPRRLLLLQKEIVTASKSHQTTETKGRINSLLNCINTDKSLNTLVSIFVWAKLDIKPRRQEIWKNHWF